MSFRVASERRARARHACARLGWLQLRWVAQLAVQQSCSVTFCWMMSLGSSFIQQVSFAVQALASSHDFGLWLLALSFSLVVKTDFQQSCCRIATETALLKEQARWQQTTFSWHHRTKQNNHSPKVVPAVPISVQHRLAPVSFGRLKKRPNFLPAKFGR